MKLRGKNTLQAHKHFCKSNRKQHRRLNHHLQLTTIVMLNKKPA